MFSLAARSSPSVAATRAWGGLARGGAMTPAAATRFPTSTRARAAQPAAFSSWARQAGMQNYRGGGRRGDVDPDTALYGLIAANAAVFGAWRLADSRPGLRASLSRHAVTSPAAVLQGHRPWTLLTSAFSHRDTGHLLVNMVTFYFFGGSVGRAFGGRRLIGLYLAAGLAGSAAQVGADVLRCRNRFSKPGFLREACISAAPGCLGASGAVNGILAVSILSNPRATVLVYGILPVPAFLLGALYIAQDLRGARRSGNGGGGGIAHWGHLGGAALGALVWATRVRTGRWW